MILLPETNSARAALIMFANSDIDVMLISEAFDRNDDKIRAKAWMTT
jgi:hypothetical protein